MTKLSNDFMEDGSIEEKEKQADIINTIYADVVK